MYIPKYYRESIKFAISELECAMMSGDCAEEVYQKHITILEQLLSDSNNGSNN